MPKLVPYESKQAAPTAGPVSTGGAGAWAMGLGAEGEKFGDVLMARANQEEATRITAKAQELTAAANVKLEEVYTSAPLDDTTVGRRFIDYLDTELDKLGEDIQGADGRALYERQRSQIRSTFETNAAVKQANLAGKNAVATWTTGSNLSSSAVKLNPGLFELHMSFTNDAAAALAGTIPAAQIEELLLARRKEMSAAVITGLADRGQFDLARAELEGPRYDKYLDASDKETLQANIRAAEQAAKSDAATTEVEARRVQDAEFGAARVDIVKKMPVGPKGLGLYPGIFDDIRNLPGKTSEQAAAMIAMERYASSLLAEANGETWKEDEPTKAALWARVYKETDDPTQVITDVHAATGNRLISAGTAGELLKAAMGGDDPQRVAAGKEIEDFTQSYRSLITKSGPYGAIDGTGDQRYGEFQEQARVIAREGAAAGIPMEKIKERILAVLNSGRYSRSAEQILESLNTNIAAGDRPIPPLPRVAPIHGGIPGLYGGAMQLPANGILGGLGGSNDPAIPELGPDAANAALGIDGMIQPPKNDPNDNIQNPYDPMKYPAVQNADGSWSNVVTKSWSFAEKDEDGNLRDVHVLLPTMIGGRKLKDDEAIDHYLNTGEYFRKFTNEAAAKKFSDILERDMQLRIQPRGTPSVKRIKPGQSPGDYLRELGL